MGLKSTGGSSPSAQWICGEGTTAVFIFISGPGQLREVHTRVGYMEHHVELKEEPGQWEVSE